MGRFHWAVSHPTSTQLNYCREEPVTTTCKPLEKAVSIICSLLGLCKCFLFPACPAPFHDPATSPTLSALHHSPDFLELLACELVV